MLLYLITQKNVHPKNNHKKSEIRTKQKKWEYNTTLQGRKIKNN